MFIEKNRQKVNIMDSPIYRQRVVIDQINARNQMLKQFDHAIMIKNRQIDRLEEDISFLSFNKKYPFEYRKVSIEDEIDAMNARKPLIEKADNLRASVHNINEQKNRYIAMHYPDLMKPHIWFMTVDSSSSAKIKKLITECQQNAQHALQMAKSCFEPQKHAVYVDHWRKMYVNNLLRQKYLMGEFVRSIYGDFGYDTSKIEIVTN